MFEIITIDELLNRLDKYSHKELHVHHTWKPSHKDFNGSNGIKLQQGMRNYHVNSLGWQDIGQHVTLLPDGTFVTGRDFSKAPASISGYNTGAFACEMLGNFDNGNDTLQGKQRDSIIRLAKYFNDKGRYIRFHRENSNKSCPGTSIDKEVFMSEVKSYGETQQKYYISTGSFNNAETAEEALKKYFTQKGLWGRVKFYIESGYFNNEEAAQTVIDDMAKDGLWAEVEVR